MSRVRYTARVNYRRYGTIKKPVIADGLFVIRIDAYSQMQPGVFGQATLLLFDTKVTTGVITALATLATFWVGTQMQDEPVGMHT